MTGAVSELPSASELHRAGIETFVIGNEPAAQHTGGDYDNTLVESVHNEADMDSKQQLISIGAGLPSLPAKLVRKIHNMEYIDFADLPPARGKSRTPHSLEGQVIVVQAADLLQTRKIIPDLATWQQCYAVYVAALASRYPRRVPELMAYQTIIAKASQKYWWPSLVVYDQNFRQEAAGNVM